jgi:FkbM family methyltransferase
MKTPTIDVFYVTYGRDAEWFKWSTATVEKNLTGYRRIVAVAPRQDKKIFDAIARERSTLKMHYVEDWPGAGYYWQQAIKFSGDKYTDAKIIAHIDSDIMIAKPTDMSECFIDGKPAWMWSFYSAFKGHVPWREPTERATGLVCEREWMQAFPFALHRSLYQICRDHIQQKTGRTYEQYIRECAPAPGQPPGFSEFNFMGRIAWEKQHDLYHWVDRNAERWPESAYKIRNFWSHAPVVDCLPEIQQMLNGGTDQRLRVTDRGIWVISNDSHISKWVEQEGRLDHDTYALGRILPHIKSGDTVVDVGAFIGDHTIAYAHATHGIDSGRVLAFEPNPLPFECLRRNMTGLAHVQCINKGLSNKPGEMAVVASDNAGASHLGRGEGVPIVTLDSLELDRLDFLKIDAEGMEFRILRGATQTIARCKPTMYIEINQGALERAGTSAAEVYAELEMHGYRMTGIEDGPQFDIFAIPPPKDPRLLVVALGVCDKDVYLARLWLHWVSFLCTQPGGDLSLSTLVVTCTQRVTKEQRQQLDEAIVRSKYLPRVVFRTCPDEQEAGYPGSASHLFLRALEACAEEAPKAAILWCETDTVAMRPSWVREIEIEYNACGRPFMGDRAGPNEDSHMTGNAVYPPNWRELAPLIVDSARPQPVKFAGHKSGVAWDVHAQSQITPRMHACKTIHQIWRPALFNEQNLSQVRPEAALFHQDKTGSLILALARVRYPAFISSRQAKPRYWTILHTSMALPDGPDTIRFQPCQKVSGAGWVGVYQSTGLMDEMLLSARSMQQKGVDEITEAEYRNLLAQAPSLRLLPP